MTRKGMRNLGFGIFALFSATAVSFLSFISMELAIAVFALTSVVFIVALERTRRAHWEQAVDFKIKEVNRKHSALSRQVMRNRNIVDNLEEDVATNVRKDSVSFKTLVKDAPSIAKPKPLKAMALPTEDIIARKTPTVTVLEDQDSLSDLVVQELTDHALKSKRIDIFMQPVMRLPQRQRKFYEVFGRVRAKPGVYIPASRYLNLAKKNDQIQDIDALLLTQCLEIVRHTGKNEQAPTFFINITVKTLKDSQFMGKLLSFFAKNRSLADKLVFEMPQAVFHDLPVSVLKIMHGLSQLGCSFSLDHVTSLDEDIRDLQRFNVRYLKASADMFADAAKDERKYKAIMKAKRMLEGNGIGLITEKIEDEAMMRSILDFELHYGQGYLFGRPDLQGAYEPEVTAKRA